MPTREIAGATVDVNEEGYFTDPDQWTEAMAPVWRRRKNWVN